MSEFKGTKGNWKYEVKSRKNSTSITVQIPERESWNRELVLGVLDREDDCGDPTCCRTEEHANAKLISCAPEMLEMLERVLTAKFTCEEIKQLIKKATE